MVQIKVCLSDQARTEYAARTGELLPDEWETSVDLAEWPADQRAALFAQAGLSEPLDLAMFTSANQRYYVHLPAVPEDVAGWARAIALFGEARSIRAAADEDKRAKAAVAQAVAVARCEAEIAALEAADDAAILARLQESWWLNIELPKGCPEACVARRERLIARGRALQQAKCEAQDAEKRAEREARESAKRAWVEANGSAHLRRCIAAGYDCQRLYTTERAALEFPGFVLDWEDNAVCRSRSCPSEAAMNLVEALAERCQAAGVSAGVVWLTAPPHDEGGVETDYAEWFEAQEAVVVADYLGHDLIQTI